MGKVILPARRCSRTAHRGGWVAALLILIMLTSWAGALQGPSGQQITEHGITGGGGAMAAASGTQVGAAGQAAVGLSQNGGGMLHHGLLAPALWPAGSRGPLTIGISGDAVVNVSIGDSHTFSAIASGGTGTLTFQWYHSDGVGGYQPVPGATSASLALTDIQAQAAGLYKCEVSDDLTSALSEAVELAVDYTLPTSGALGLIVTTIAFLVAGFMMSSKLWGSFRK